MIADRLRAAILQAAISGKLTDQRPGDGTAAELLEQIADERAHLVKDGRLKKQKPLPSVAVEDRPFLIPSSWVWTRVGEVAKYAQRGKSPTYADVSPFLAVSQKCIRWSGFDSTVARPYAPEAFAALPKDRILSAGDILWNSTGTGTVGRSTVLPESGNYDTMAADSHVTVIRTFPMVLPRFIDVFISSPHIQQNMDDLTSGTTKQQELNLGTILELPLPLPPLAEQERIVAKVDEFLPLIGQLAELEKDRESLDREFAAAIERAILQAAISGKLTKQLPDDGTAAELIETIQTERRQLEEEGKIKKQKPLSVVSDFGEPFDLPKTWEWAQIGSVVDLLNGRAYKQQELQTSGTWPVLRVGNLFTNERWYYSDLDLEEDKYCEEGDLLYAWSASFGPHIWHGPKSIFHYHIWKVRHYSMNRDYLDHVLQWDVNRIRTATTGSTMAHVSMANMRPRTIPVAPGREQDRIVSRLKDLLPLAKSIRELVS